MSPISLSLDLLLMVLLMAALGFGWRLERRLKGLRESHADFAGAVADLDRAAQRAEVGLAKLREATDEAVDLLAGRIEKARELTVKLEKLTQDAAAASQRPASQRPANLRPANDAPRAGPDRPLSKPAASPPPSPVDAVLAAESLARRLSQDDSLVLRTPVARAAPRSAPIAAPRPAPRPLPRPSIDDDLFEAPARMAAGGLARAR